MAQTTEGAKKSRARRAGVSVVELVAKEAAGLKWCYKCKQFVPRAEFCSDCTRHDGLACVCGPCRRVKVRKPFKPGINPVTGKPGPAPKAYVGRDGDKKQARYQVNLEVLTGRIPSPNSLPCDSCGHIGDGKRHEYHHHLGYEAKHHLDVIPLCSTCHATERLLTNCKRGHLMSGDNVGISGGRRFCLECRRLRDRGRRDAEFWRNYRKRRKEFPRSAK